VRDRILITGTSGRVGRRIIPLLRSHFALRLLDLEPPTAEGDDEVLRADIQDFPALRGACEGAKALVHLAAVSDEDDFMTRLLPMNVVGLYNAFEAARQAGVRKVLFTSTGQTILNNPKDAWITTDMPPRPSTIYACTKLFGEAMARYYSDAFGMSMIVIRLCWFQGYDSEALRESREINRQWCSPGDLTQLIVKAIASDVKFGVFFGVSNNTNRRLDIRNAQEMIGYQPQDDSAKLRAPF
jgi:NAD+ dependent glucose-6-phosphate dehydrogenase